MDERAERIGQNEALFRDVNEQVLRTDERFGGAGERLITFFCECGDFSCAKQIELTVSEYEDVRADGALFAVVPGHEIPDVETIVGHLGERAVVVRKHAGDPAQAARADDGS